MTNANNALEGESHSKIHALTASGVTKRFSDGTQALSDVNLELEKGSFTGLIGPSGCGKSTLLRIMANLTPPTNGSLSRHYTSQQVGFVFQEPTLMPWRSALRNVTMPLELQGVAVGKAQKLARDVLAQVGLEDFENSYPRELSGGMKMRVSIARALVTEPSVLFLDEPFAALDEITRFDLNNDLLTLWKNKRFTAVFVTHSIYESVFLAERVIIMAARPGRIFSEVEVGAQLKRTGDFRSTREYAELCTSLSDTLSDAMQS